MADSPSSFDEDDAADWNLWVLEHGLPDPPRVLEKGQSVPIARWVGPTFGAVLRVEWSWSLDISHDDQLESVVQVFRRTSRGWEDTAGDGGGGWFYPPLKRPVIGGAETHVGSLHASGGENWMAAALWGFVGSDITTLDLISDDLVITRDVESSIGAVVLAFDATIPSVIHMSATDGTVLKAVTYNPDTFSFE